jgi:hypothetical protein
MEGTTLASEIPSEPPTVMQLPQNALVLEDGHNGTSHIFTIVCYIFQEDIDKIYEAVGNKNILTKLRLKVG